MRFDEKLPWHLQDDSEAVHALTAYIDELWAKQQCYRDKMLRHFSFYYGRVLGDWSELSVPDRSHDSWSDDSDASDVFAWNLTRSIVDAYVSRVGANQPEPRFLTEGSSYEQQEQSRNREQFVRGAMKRARTRQHAKTALWSSAICGTGAIKTYSRGSDVFQRYLRPDLVLVDPDSIMDDGTPRCIYHREAIPRSELLAFASDSKTKESIMFASRHDARSIEDRILVIEAWARPLGNQSGRHMIIIPGVDDALIDEEWDSEAPISLLSFARVGSGHHGDSLAGIVEGCARVINRLLWKSLLNHDHLAVPMLLAPSSLEPLLRDNRQLRYLPSDEGVPQVIAPNAIPPETLTLIGMCWEKGYEISGMSQYAAMGTRPPGIDSGRAIVEHNDLQTLRFSDPELVYEEYQGIELARQILLAGKRIEDEDGWSVSIEEDSLVRKIKWIDLDLEGEWNITIWPASQLGSTPAGRRQAIGDIWAQGAIDRDEYRRLLRLPDLERTMNLTTSPSDLWRFVLENVASNKAWIQPMEYDVPDLAQGILMARQYRAREIVEGRMDAAQRIEDWINEAVMIIEESQQPETPVQPEQIVSEQVIQ